jgi:transposase
MKKQRKTHTKEFKIEAVRLATTGDVTISEVSKKLGISQSQLSRWIKSLQTEGEDAFRGNGRRTLLEEENWRLKQQLKRSEQELSFLKKVSRYFAKAPE